MKNQDQKVYVPKEFEYEGSSYDVSQVKPFSELTEQELEDVKKYYLSLFRNLPNEIRQFVLGTITNNNVNSLIKKYEEKVKLLNNNEQKTEQILYRSFILELKTLD